ncbi:TPA: hypothetical protein QB345_000318 [Pasteurella multocida]|nr:hypothetical protein [Pasteurella multocida]
MNILEIYQNNPNTVFISRDGTRCKVEIHDATASAFQFKMLPLDGGDSFWVDGNSKRTSIFDCDNNKDIVDYERPIFTVGEYVTRDGRKATVYYDLSDRFDMLYPLYGYVEGNEDYDKWTKKGEYDDSKSIKPNDLIGPWVEKPYIITVNGKEFHPVKNPKDGERLFYVNLLSSYVANSAAWGKQRSTDTALSNLNLIYRTEEEAQAFLEEISKPHTEIKHVD